VSFSLKLTEEQEQARQWARDFARKEIREAEVEGLPAHRYYDEVEEFPWPIVEKAARSASTAWTTTRWRARTRPA
jgi:acyl-CoA dehydrogenase